MTYNNETVAAATNRPTSEASTAWTMVDQLKHKSSVTVQTLLKERGATSAPVLKVPRTLNDPLEV